MPYHYETNITTIKILIIEFNASYARQVDILTVYANAVPILNSDWLQGANQIPTPPKV